ncbi:DUF5666 domain-containing protein [Arthrobacter bambusae]|uniref:DUF5666 domain-containing protein n=1 Tax=Arthrobacter bambusae TaxID=1338426 RepID=UPI00277F1DAD|nr:hypothetical protein [Arthrobacter bambusae]MDQ0029159.1 hypothetical protein [Arthrobacter bambusae]MDQ0098068.1 hypothetical protein [Arthrobacter bambusae]
MSTMSPGLRKALIAGGIAVVLSGGGVAAVWAAGQVIPSYVVSATPTDTASPATPSPGATSPGAPSPGKARPFPAPPRGFAVQRLHGEFTVKNKDGTFTTLVMQRGTVQSVSDSNISVKSDDGFTQSYAITSSTTIVKLPASGTGMQGRKPSPQSIKASDLKAGDTVAVSGTKSGTTVTATRITAGTPRSTQLSRS